MNNSVEYWKERAEAAEEELRKAREQEPVAWCDKSALKAVLVTKAYWSPRCLPDGLGAPLYAAPKPAAPAVPEEWREVINDAIEVLAHNNWRGDLQDQLRAILGAKP